MVNRFLARLAEPVTEHETVGIFQALGRVLACNLISPISVPAYDNSAMDGYAFLGAQLARDTPLVLKVIGTVLAGQVWPGKVETGECVKIMTGAMLPQQLDTVAPQELVTVRPAHDRSLSARAETITIAPGLLQTGDNRRLLGEDLQRGQTALQQGELLTPAALGLIASLGIEKVPVLRRLRVAYFSTGDEILSLGEA